MTIVPLCMRCRHLRAELTDAGRYACDAFPAGIPNTVMLMDHDHRAPYPGDGGILFEPAEDLAPSPAPAGETPEH